MSEKETYKICPFCKEQIRKAAMKCRFCGEWLDKAPQGTEEVSTILPGESGGKDIALDADEGTTSTTKQIDHAGSAAPSVAAAVSGAVSPPKPPVKRGSWQEYWYGYIYMAFCGYLTFCAATNLLVKAGTPAPVGDLQKGVEYWGFLVLETAATAFLAYVTYTISQRRVKMGFIYIVITLHGLNVFSRGIRPIEVMIWLILSWVVANKFREQKRPDDAGYELLQIATQLETKGRVQDALAAYREIAEKYSRTGPGQDAQKSFESLQSKIHSVAKVESPQPAPTSGKRNLWPHFLGLAGIIIILIFAFSHACNQTRTHSGNSDQPPTILLESGGVKTNGMYRYEVQIPDKGKFLVESPTELNDQQAFAAAQREAENPEKQQKGMTNVFGDPIIGIDPDISIEKLRRLAESGRADAQGMLGLRYLNGSNVIKDYVEAAKWFCKAPDQGNALAQADLGYCYAQGLGIQKDVVQAYKWDNLATAQGQPGAIKNLALLEMEMTPEQIAVAQKKAREFKAFTVVASGIDTTNGWQLYDITVDGEAPFTVETERPLPPEEFDYIVERRHVNAPPSTKTNR
jgi:TPR repeat protein